MPRKITDFDFSFDSCFKIVVGVEGGFQANINDRGNWTSGKIGQGELKGTKYGVSAMAYPTIDIKAMSLAEAKNIYLNDYWVRLSAHPLKLNLIIFDCAINQGLSFANSLIASAKNLATIEQQIEYIRVKRLERYQINPKFEFFKNGWLSRLEDVVTITNDNLKAVI